MDMGGIEGRGVEGKRGYSDSSGLRVWNLLFA